MASQEVINTTSPSLTNIVNTRQVVDLPLGDRNPLILLDCKQVAVVGTDVRFAVSGLRQTAVNLTQDGINAMDNFVKTSSFFALTTPSLNSTAEFTTTGTVGRFRAARRLIWSPRVVQRFHGGAFLQIINDRRKYMVQQLQWHAEADPASAL
jgi:hypothetical protein